MIIISASCRKSASTLIFDYQREIITLFQPRNGQLIIPKFSTGKGYRGQLDLKTFILLLYINFRYGSVVLKTHSGPTFYVRLLVNLGLAKVTYSYRDPRDVVLSMIDHGNRTRKQLKEQGESLDTIRGFADIYSVKDAVTKAMEEINNWYGWKNFKDVLFIKYETFIPNQITYLKKMATYFGYELEEKDMNYIQEKYGTKSRNFNKGLAGRYATDMNDEDLKLCNKIFHSALEDMEYFLENV